MTLRTVFERVPPGRHVLSVASLLLAMLMLVWSPFSGGSRLPTMLLALLGGVLLLNARANLFKQLAMQRWTSLFLLLWLPMWLSLWHSFSPGDTLQAVAWFGLMYPAGIALIAGLQPASHRRWFAVAMSALMALWIQDSAVQYLSGSDMLGNAQTVDGRITGMFSDLHQGLLMLTLLPLVLDDLRRRLAWLAWAMLLVGGLVIALSGARGYLYLYGLMLLLGLWRAQAGWKAWSLLLLPPLLALLVSVLNPQLAKLKLENTEVIVASQLTTFERINQALSQRLLLWETGVHMFISQPVTGIGSHTFKRAYPHYASRAQDPFIHAPTHTHHIYIEWLAETGTVGGLALLGVIMLCVRWFRQAELRYKQQAWPFALPLMAIFFPLNTTQPMLVPWWFPVLMLLCCAMLASLEGGSHDATA